MNYLAVEFVAKTLGIQLDAQAFEKLRVIENSLTTLLNKPDKKDKPA